MNQYKHLKKHNGDQNLLYIDYTSYNDSFLYALLTDKSYNECYQYEFVISEPMKDSEYNDQQDRTL